MSDKALERYVKGANPIVDDLLKIVSKYFIEGTRQDEYAKNQQILIEAGNNIVDWRRLLK